MGKPVTAQFVSSDAVAKVKTTKELLAERLAGSTESPWVFSRMVSAECHTLMLFGI